MKILLLDNYDSFTYNLLHYLEGLGCDVEVMRNDEVLWEKVPQFDKIVLSPGPGLPEESGELMRLIGACHTKQPILGVCLGLQALGLYFGDELYNMSQVKHGVPTELNHLENCTLYHGLPKKFQVGLYHSWALRLKENSPLQATAFDETGVLMSLRHKELPLYGVQYHPESILSENGRQILANFISA